MMNRASQRRLCRSALVWLLGLAALAQARAGDDRAPTAPGFDRLRGSAPVLRAFQDAADRDTGLAPSFLQIPTPATEVHLYDAALLLIAAPDQAPLLVRTFARKNSEGAAANRPVTAVPGDKYVPAGGWYNTIRIGDFRGEWWNHFEWACHAGPNAWIGIALAQHASRTGDAEVLRLAEERADFLLRLQDSASGAVRMGPRGQGPPQDPDLFWHLLSTENNESALCLLDLVHGLTRQRKYRDAADRVYAWLLGRAYDRRAHGFFRGGPVRDGRWVPDGHDRFAPDTAFWAPLERMLEDPFLGPGRAERLEEVVAMLETAERWAGVAPYGKLLGIGFSRSTAGQGTITPEWSCQYALRRLRVAQEWNRLGQLEKARASYDQYRRLLQSVRSFFREHDGRLAAPYAVTRAGRIAVIDTEHGWKTPNAYGSLASAGYYAFANAAFDPLVLGGGEGVPVALEPRRPGGGPAPAPAPAVAGGLERPETVPEYVQTHKVPEEKGFPEPSADPGRRALPEHRFVPLLPADGSREHREPPALGWGRTWVLVLDLDGRFVSLDVLAAAGHLDFALTGNVGINGRPVEERDFARQPLTAGDRIRADFLTRMLRDPATGAATGSITSVIHAGDGSGFTYAEINPHVAAQFPWVCDVQQCVHRASADPRWRVREVRTYALSEDGELLFDQQLDRPSYYRRLDYVDADGRRRFVLYDSEQYGAATLPPPLPAHGKLHVLRPGGRSLIRDLRLSGDGPPRPTPTAVSAVLKGRVRLGERTYDAVVQEGGGGREVFAVDAIGREALRYYFFPSGRCEAVDVTTGDVYLADEHYQLRERWATTAFLRVIQHEGRVLHVLTRPFLDARQPREIVYATQEQGKPHARYNNKESPDQLEAYEIGGRQRSFDVEPHTYNLGKQTGTNERISELVYQGETFTLYRLRKLGQKPARIVGTDVAGTERVRVDPYRKEIEITGRDGLTAEVRRFDLRTGDIGPLLATARIAWDDDRTGYRVIRTPSGPPAAGARRPARVEVKKTPHGQTEWLRIDDVVMVFDADFEARNGFMKPVKKYRVAAAPRGGEVRQERKLAVAVAGEPPETVTTVEADDTASTGSGQEVESLRDVCGYLRRQTRTWRDVRSRTYRAETRYSVPEGEAYFEADVPGETVVSVDAAEYSRTTYAPVVSFGEALAALEIDLDALDAHAPALQIKQALARQGITAATAVRPATTRTTHGASWTEYRRVEDGSALATAMAGTAIVNVEWESELSAEWGEERRARKSYKVTRGSQVSAEYDFLGNRSVGDLADLFRGSEPADRLRAELVAGLRQEFGLEPADALPVIAERPWLRRSTPDGGVEFRPPNPSRKPTEVYLLPRAALNPKLAVCYPPAGADQTAPRAVILNEWWKAGGPGPPAPPGVPPSYVVFRPEAREWDRLVYGGARLYETLGKGGSVLGLEGIPAHTLSPSGSHVAALVYESALPPGSGAASAGWLRREVVTADGQLAAQGFRHLLVRLANGMGGVLVDDEEYVLLDLTVPFQKPVFSFVCPPGARERGEARKVWLGVQYDADEAGAQLETHLVDEFEPLNEKRHNRYGYRYHDGELNAKWRKDLVSSLVVGSAGPWQSPLVLVVLPLAGLVVGFPLAINLAARLVANPFLPWGGTRRWPRRARLAVVRLFRLLDPRALRAGIRLRPPRRKRGAEGAEALVRRDANPDCSPFSPEARPEPEQESDALNPLGAPAPPT